MACLVREMVLTLIVPVAPANAPVPPVTLPLVTTPVLGLKVNVQYKNPPLVSTVKFTARLLGEVAAKYSLSKPTVLPVVLTSVSWMPPVALVKPTVAFCTAVNLSVCVALCALATAGSTNAPVVPRTTAAPAAASDVRGFMILSPIRQVSSAGRQRRCGAGRERKLPSGTALPGARCRGPGWAAGFAAPPGGWPR